MINRLKNRFVQLLRRIRSEGQSQAQECVGKSRDTNADGSVAKVGGFSAGDRVLVDVYYFVEVAGYYFSDGVECGVVEVGGGL